MTTSFKLLLASGKAKAELESARAFNDIQWPRKVAFNSLAFSVAMLFLSHAELEELSINCLTTPEFVEDECSHVIKLTQHLKVSTTGKSVFKDIEAKSQFFAEHAPSHLMGSGFFTINRKSSVIAEILANPDEASALVAVGILAEMLESSFKTIYVAGFGGVFLG